LANGRYRYEQTDESLISIASDFGVNRNTFRALAVRQGWVRYKPPPRDLLPAAKLLAQADDLKDLGTQDDAPSAPAVTLSEEKPELQHLGLNHVAENRPALPPPGDTIIRLHRAVLEELSAVEAMRARLKREPQNPIDAERTARTLSSLTETLQKLQRLQCTLRRPSSKMMMTCLPTSMNSVTNLRAALMRSSIAGLEGPMLSELPLRPWVRFDRDFIALAHRHQEPPAHANNGGPWTTWLMLGGRGAGKTRLGAEWVRAQACGTRPYADQRSMHIALVGETEHDVREVMIEGPSGLLRAAPYGERPLWIPSRRRLEWNNGAAALAFSAEDPEQLRGPQFDAAWCDELAKWRHVDATFDMLQFGLRLGARPRQLITTTPRPIALIKRLLADPRTAVTRASTHVNAAHLSPAFLDEVLARYTGTRLGRQEIDGEIIEDRADALWTRAMIEAARVPKAPPLLLLVVGVDPPGSTRPGSDACGIVAAGIAESGTIYVLADATVHQLAPHGWASAVVALFSRLKADLVVAEGNQGGDMVRAVLQQIDPAIPVRTVHATRGKWLRAEPVAMRYQQGEVKHVGPPLQALEDQMCDFGISGLSSGASPDRLDALVWAVTDLMKRGTGPRITVL